MKTAAIVVGLLCVAAASDSFWQFVGAFGGAFAAVYAKNDKKRIALIIDDGIKAHERRMHDGPNPNR